MTNDRVEDLLRGDVPAEDPHAQERARIRLRAAIALETVRPPVRRRSHLAAFAAASLVAVVVLLAQILLPAGPVGPQLGVAAEIRQLGELSSRQASLQIGASDYLYRREESVRQESHVAVGVGSSYDLQIDAIVESWAASDGSGRTLTSYRDVDFRSEVDRRAWIEAGSPPRPAMGTSVDEDHAAGELRLYAVDDLPTETTALGRALSEGSVIDAAPGDANLLSTIGILLAQGNAPPDLRNALFEVAAAIPGVMVDEQATDPVGREAVSVSVADPVGQTRLFFDPIDASLLGSSRDHPATDDSAGGTEWHAYLGWSVVPSVRERPST